MLRVISVYAWAPALDTPVDKYTAPPRHLMPNDPVHVSAAQICHYGTKPGHWEPDPAHTYKWQLDDEGCPLQDLVATHYEVCLKFH